MLDKVHAKRTLEFSLPQAFSHSIPGANTRHVNPYYTVRSRIVKGRRGENALLFGDQAAARTRSTRIGKAMVKVLPRPSLLSTLTRP